MLVKLHNQFVLSILKNARCPQPPPEFSKQLTGKKRRRPERDGLEPNSKRSKKKKIKIFN